jgi:Arc/MetJ-type ribon-helix-helix transcriptional regulator
MQKKIQTGFKLDPENKRQLHELVHRVHPLYENQSALIRAVIRRLSGMDRRQILIWLTGLDEPDLAAQGPEPDGGQVAAQTLDGVRRRSRKETGRSAG